MTEGSLGDDGRWSKQREGGERWSAARGKGRCNVTCERVLMRGARDPALHRIADLHLDLPIKTPCRVWQCLQNCTKNQISWIVHQKRQFYCSNFISFRLIFIFPFPFTAKPTLMTHLKSDILKICTKSYYPHYCPI